MTALDRYASRFGKQLVPRWQEFDDSAGLNDRIGADSLALSSGAVV
jgi:hypothetical protein